MQNYRNNAMPYNVACGNSYNGNYRYAPQVQSSNNERRAADCRSSERRDSSAECCTSANEVKSSCMDDMVLAMAYVKWQTWQNIYDVEKALHRGTIFQELDLPFCGIGGCQK